MKLRLFSCGLNFIKQMPRRKLAVSVLVLFAAIGGVFLVTRQIFKADTPHTDSTASVSYLDSTGNPAEVTSNTVSLNITAGNDAKATIKTQMEAAAVIAKNCVTFGGDINEDTAGISDICNVTDITDPTQKSQVAGKKYPTLFPNYYYDYTHSSPDLPLVMGPYGSTLKCTIDGCGNWTAEDAVAKTTGLFRVIVNSDSGLNYNVTLEVKTEIGDNIVKTGTVDTGWSTDIGGITPGRYYIHYSADSVSGETAVFDLAAGSTVPVTINFSE